MKAHLPAVACAHEHSRLVAQWSSAVINKYSVDRMNLSPERLQVNSSASIYSSLTDSLDLNTTQPATNYSQFTYLV